MSFEVRLQRDPFLPTPQDIRNDANLQKVSGAIRAAYMKKEVPTDANTVKTEIEKSFPSTTMTSGIVYRQYVDSVTGEKYWCCTISNTIQVQIQGEDPIVVEIGKTELVP